MAVVPRLLGFVVLVVIAAAQAPSTPSVTPLVPEVVWNLGSHTLYQVRLDRLFSGVENATVTLDPPESSWYRAEVVEQGVFRYLRVSKKHVPTARTKLVLSSRIVAMASDGGVQASVALQAVVPPHEVTYRYPTGPPGSAGSVWYPDETSAAAPTTFEYAGTYGARYDTLRISDSQPADIAGEQEWRGRLYTHDAPISPDNGAVVTASVWVDGAWVTSPVKCAMVLTTCA